MVYFFDTDSKDIATMRAKCYVLSVCENFDHFRISRYLEW